MPARASSASSTISHAQTRTIGKKQKCPHGSHTSRYVVLGPKPFSTPFTVQNELPVILHSTPTYA